MSSLSGKSTSSGIEVSTGLGLENEKKLFYIGIAGYGVVPQRIFGVWNPILKTGFGYFGGKENEIAVSQEFGIRLTRITPRIYVDVAGGGFAGYDFADEKMKAGVAATIQAHYTGIQADYGLMVKKLWNLVGDKNGLIIGVSGRF